MNCALQNTIEQAWENRNELSPSNVSPEVRDAIETALAGLDNGSLRVAEKNKQNGLSTNG